MPSAAEKNKSILPPSGEKQAALGARRRARIAAFFWIFAETYTGVWATDAARAASLKCAGERGDDAPHGGGLAEEIYAAYAAHRAALKTAVNKSVSGAANTIAAAEFAILLAAAAEMSLNQTPRAVIINESVEIAKRYGGEGGWRLVNAALDSLRPSAKK